MIVSDTWWDTGNNIRVVHQGQTVCREDENSRWPPHLHPLSTQRLASFLIHGACARQKQTLWGEWFASWSRLNTMGIPLKVIRTSQDTITVIRECVSIFIIRKTAERSWLFYGTGDRFQNVKTLELLTQGTSLPGCKEIHQAVFEKSRMKTKRRKTNES